MHKFSHYVETFSSHTVLHVDRINKKRARFFAVVFSGLFLHSTVSWEQQAVPVIQREDRRRDNTGSKAL